MEFKVIRRLLQWHNRVEGYQEWYGITEEFNRLVSGILVVFVGVYLYIYMRKGVHMIVTFGISFMDSSSVFAEHLVHLYNIVWIILIFVVVLITILLIRIIYLFNWKYHYFNNIIYTEVINYFLDYLLVICIILDDKNFILAILERKNNISSSFNSNNVGLNLWYKKSNYLFLQISDISEYRLLEVLWCLLPIGSLLFISTPTFSLIFSLDACVDPMYTVKIIGRQWYWNYSFDLFLNNRIDKSTYYPLISKFEAHVSEPFIFQFINGDKSVKVNVDKSIYDYLISKIESHVSEPIIFQLINRDKSIEVNVDFDSVMISTDDLQYGHRLLEVDNRLFLPVGVPIRLLITSSDVLHSWAVPSLGIKVDAVPGRLNQFIVEIKRPGVFYGQCSELCGINHGFMPIVIQAISQKKFENWLLLMVNK